MLLFEQLMQNSPNNIVCREPLLDSGTAQVLTGVVGNGSSLQQLGYSDLADAEVERAADTIARLCYTWVQVCN